MAPPKDAMALNARLRAMRSRVDACYSSLPVPDMTPLTMSMAPFKGHPLGNACIDLARANMRDVYARSGWKWSDDDKRSEFAEPGMRLLVITDGAQLAAFTSFLIDTEETADPAIPHVIVVYCYELQVSDAHRRRGLGRHLMRLLEQLGSALGASKVMLTVLKRNTAAVDFYKRVCGYQEDEISPGRYARDATAVYEILSKPCTRPASPSATGAY